MLKSVEDMHHLIERFTFENLVVGEPNRAGYLAARKVANGVCKNNPLTFYGEQGIGKTHLLFAIANALLKKDASARVQYVDAPRYVFGLDKALYNGTVDDFMHTFSGTRILLMDEIQFFAGRQEAQTQFLMTFDALKKSGCQMVFVSSWLSAHIDGLDDRLMSRLSEGKIVHIEPPDTETATAIVKAWVAEQGLRISDDAVSHLVRHSPPNIRFQLGVLMKLRARYRWE